ncbi:general L-amino acid transport system permease protein/general L-amino acid transport system permease protein [Paracoccus isoporae]|uniref:General L-amino acid transport system permease protein/general L-amino acid transport system permease protein n=1 Tax=Paracoccus isoporae TaxID=591205 RepID=A0A1G7GZV0_9RHOB|nr:ABC transporter permease subunit [Paracoccus isoporae]SDE93702.1 general L-amino acid transport system permease protein/general L-amino acid transport system permease protein [Paracoccus isoporae]
MPGFLRNQKVRNALLQALFVAVVLVIVLGGWRNAQQTLEAQNMVSGFGFLDKSTGWDLTFSLLPTSSSDPYWWFFVVGILNTLFLGIIGLALATLIGGIIGIMRTLDNPVLNLLGRSYVDFFRNIPLILQVFFWYAVVTHLPSPREAATFGPLTMSSRGIYMPALNVGGWYLFAAAIAVLAAVVLPFWVGRTRRIARPPESRHGLIWAAFLVPLALAIAIVLIGRDPAEPLLSIPALGGLNIRGGLRISPEFSAMLISIGIYGGAYIAEIVRGGFKAVGKGQTEAAHALGLTPLQSFFRIRLPLALRAMLPILANQYIWLIKATTMGIAIGFNDFFMIVAVTINQSGQTIEAIAILMAGFLAINLTLAAIFNRINKAIALKGNQLRS